MGGIGQDRIVHAQQPRVTLEPCLVAEVAVGASPDDDRFLGLEVGLQLPERDEFGGADECEIPWIENSTTHLPRCSANVIRLGPWALLSECRTAWIDKHSEASGLGQ